MLPVFKRLLVVPYRRTSRLSDERRVRALAAPRAFVAERAGTTDALENGGIRRRQGLSPAEGGTLGTMTWVAEHPDAEHQKLGDYVDVLRRRRWIVILVTAGVMMSALLVSVLQDTTYEATAEVLLQARRQVIFAQDGSAGAGQMTTVETEIRVIRSDPVLAAVRERLGSTPKVTATRAGETEVMKIQALAPTARQAAEFANVYADAYVQFRKEQAVADLLSASNGIQVKLTALQEELDGIDRRLSQASASERASLEATLRPRYNNLLEQQSVLAQRQDELQVEAALNTGDARVLRQASIPNAPSKPKPTRNVVAACVVGLMLGVGLAFLREQLDDSVSSREDLRRALPHLPVLGSIPLVEGWRSDDRTVVLTSAEAATSPAAEAFRALRTSVRFLGVERPLRTIQLTSPTAGEGKTTVAVNLAAVLAASGERVVIVDADLRRPTVHRMFGLDNRAGFTSVFLEEASLDDALHRRPGTDFFVLPSGPIPPNPSELLSAKRTAELLFELQERFDVVLVDSPPVLPVTDATVLAAWMEATLLVARAGVTTSAQLRQSVDLLRQVDAPIKGTILNQVQLEMTYGYRSEYVDEQPFEGPQAATRKPARSRPRARIGPSGVRGRATREPTV